MAQHALFSPPSQEEQLIKTIEHLIKTAHVVDLPENKAWYHAHAYILSTLLLHPFIVRCVWNSIEQAIIPISALIKKIENDLCDFYQCTSQELQNHLFNDIGKQISSVYFGEEKRNTIYLSAEEKKKFITAVDATGRLVRADDNKPISIGHHAESNKEPIFVIGFDGRLCVNNYDELSKLFKSRNQTSFHHSSFFEGKPVIAGGVIIIKDGIIQEISNNSGHYCPDYRNLLFALQHLFMLNVNLAHTKVKIYSSKAFTLECSAYLLLQEGSMLSFCSKSLSTNQMKYFEHMKLEIKLIEKEDYFDNLFKKFISKSMDKKDILSIDKLELERSFFDYAFDVFLNHVPKAEEYDISVKAFFEKLKSAFDFFAQMKIVLDQDAFMGKLKPSLIGKGFQLNIDSMSDRYKHVPAMNIPYGTRLAQLQQFIFNYSFNVTNNKYNKRITIIQDDGSKNEKIVPGFVKEMLDIIQNKDMKMQARLEKCLDIGYAQSKLAVSSKSQSCETEAFLSLFSENTLFFYLTQQVVPTNVLQSQNQLKLKS